MKIGPWWSQNCLCAKSLFKTAVLIVEYYTPADPLESFLEGKHPGIGFIVDDVLKNIFLL